MSEAKTIPAKYIFLDIVGFTHNRSAEAQSHIVEALNHIVETSISEHGVPRENVLFIPASDGIGVALLNIESPYDIHLLIALSIMRAVNKYNAATKDEMRRFEIRVGINSHVDNLITDINGNQNIAGAGVNIASRVMHMADGGQILASGPAFEALRYHEKYISSFKPFRAKIKHGLEMPVYQFTAPGREGLNTSVPSYFQSAQKTETQSNEQTFYGKANRQIAVETNKQPGDRQLADTWSPHPAQTAANQTQSYLKGILPEPERTETTTGWIKSKTPQTESLPFLEEAESTGRNRSWIWAALIFLLVGTSLGTWFWMRGEETSNTNRAPLNTISVAPSEAPVNTPSTASSEIPNQAPNQAVADTTRTTKPGTTFTPRPTTVSETKVKNTTAPVRLPAPAPRPVTPRRPLVQRTVAQRAQPQPKKQTVKADKPKTAKKITIDDLINAN